MIDTFLKLSAREIENISIRNGLGITFTSNSKTYTKTKTELATELNTIYQDKNATDKRLMLIDTLETGRSLVRIFEATKILYTSSLPNINDYTKTINGDMTTYIPKKLSNILTTESYVVFNKTKIIYAIKKFLQSSKIIGMSIKTANKINDHSGQMVSMNYLPKSVVTNLFSSIKNQTLCTKFSVVCSSTLKFRIFYEYHKVDSSFITFNTKLNSGNSKISKNVIGTDIDGIDSLSTSSSLFAHGATDDAIDYTIVNLPEEIQRDIKLIRVNILIQNNNNIERYLIGFLGSEMQIHNLDFTFSDLPLLGKIISYVR